MSRKLRSSNEIVYAETRRHWWEIVRESIDAVAYSAMIVAIVCIVHHYTRYSRIWFLLGLCIFPIGQLSVEIFRWNAMVYSLEVRDGGIYFRKKETKIKFWGALPEEDRQTGLKSELLMTRSNIFERWIGYKSLWLTAGGHKAFDGERVPIPFIEILESRMPKEKAVAEEAGDGFSTVLSALDRGLIGKEEARALFFKRFAEV